MSTRLTDIAYYTKMGEPVFYDDLKVEILQKAPETRGQHIFYQLNAIGRRREFNQGTTPYTLPYTFIE